MTTFRLVNPKVRGNAVKAISEAAEGCVVTIKPPTRSMEQNRLLWQRLSDLAEQVDWYGQKLTKEDWKDITTASLRKSRVVPGIDPGSFVVTGLHTSNMSKGELSDLMTLIEAFGLERGVVFKDLSEGWE